MQLSGNLYELHSYVSNFIYNNQFLANFKTPQSLLTFETVECGTY